MIKITKLKLILNQDQRSLDCKWSQIKSRSLNKWSKIEITQTYSWNT